MESRKHFHTFDALRFIAFFMVFLHHAPLDKVPGMDLLTHSGGIGVRFFFVLSGFLITYILLHEKAMRGTISLRKFFIRRVLRIWPLFYAMILFAFATPYILEMLNLPSSNEGYQPNWLMSALFLENYQMMALDDFPGVSPLGVMWSLCIEEHFYIFWGLTVFLVPLKRIPWLIGGSILIANLARVLFTLNGWDFLDLFTNLDYFAYGAIPAWLLLKQPEAINRLGNLPGATKYIVAATAIAVAFAAPHWHTPMLDIFLPALLAGLFTAVILFTLPGQNRLFLRNNLAISSMGRYTYGLYLYHTIVINLLLQVGPKMGLDAQTAMGGALIAVIALVVSVVISWASFHLFENRFIKLKKHFY